MRGEGKEENGGEGREGEGRAGEGGEGRGEDEAFLVMWPRRLSTLNPPLKLNFICQVLFTSVNAVSRNVKLNFSP